MKPATAQQRPAHGVGNPATQAASPGTRLATRAAASPADPRAALGREGEELTAARLEAEGWQILDRNWRPGPGEAGQAPLRGELDLIAQDPDGALVIVEVKTRRSERYGPPAAAVGPGKVRRLRLLAIAWVHSHDCAACGPLRLDVVSVLLPVSGAPRLRHHRGVGL